MPYVIGLDEAGYGPNLGPLVVAATVWRVPAVRTGVPDGRASRSGRKQRGAQEVASAASTVVEQPAADECDLYELLAATVSRSADGGRIAIADSKQLYKPGSGLAALERGVLTAFHALGCPTDCWQAVMQQATGGAHRESPWYDQFDAELPIDLPANELAQLAPRLSDGCQAAGVQLVAVEPRLVFPREFNELTEYYGTKGAALSHVSIGLLSKLLGQLANDGPIHVTCDKHGGRNRYLSLLQHHFAGDWIDVVVESRPVSRYEWGPVEGRVSVQFRVGGEEMLPAALASMTAKYLRELAMKALNDFWCQRVPGLRPTAGYPVDARRFKQDVAAVQQQLGVSDQQLWRNR